MNWPIKKLGNFIEIVMGQAPHSDHCNKEGEGVVFVKAGEFGIESPVIREWTTDPLKIAKADDTLICVVGATAGKINRSRFECAIGRSVAAVRTRTNEVEQNYLHEFLSTKVMELRNRSQGAAQAVITREMLQDIEISLPPLAEQQRIAALLDTANRILKLRETAITKLDQLAQSIFMDMFGDPKSTTVWDRKEISKLAKVYTGKTPSTNDQSNFDGDIPFVTPTDLRGVIKNSARKISQKGAETITVVRSGSSLVGCIGDIGRVGYVITPVTFNQQINAVDWNNQLILDIYGFYVLQYMAPVFKNKSVSAVVPILNKTNFSSVDIPVPSLNEQIKFGNIINSLWLLKDKMLSKRESELISSIQYQSFSVI
jgi:type I restriction enzyme S subunit